MPNQVAVISPEGENGYLPEDKLQEAVGRGFKPATMVTSPEGDSGWMPRENVGRAIKERGFKVGQAPTSAEASPSRQLTDHTQATLEGAGNIATGAKDAVKGAYDMVKAPEEGTTEDTVGKIAGPGGLALYRMIRGTLEGAKGVSQVPGAVRDIAANPEGANYASKIVGETAGGVAVQAAAGKVGEASGTSAAETTARVAGKFGKGLAEDIPGVRQVVKLGKYAKEAQAETAARRGTPTPEPSFPQYDKAAPKQADSAAPTQADAAPAEHPDAAQFEKTFGQPIDNYIDENGKFNKKDFLDEIVKPKTEPPNAVIAKTFGNDGVELVNKLNGKPLEKWESQAPESEPKGGSARLRAKAILKGDAGSAGAPGSIYENRDVTGELTKEVPARGFLKKVGADENAILTNKTRTPGEHADSVNYHRQQIREGKMQPAELHVDEDNNVIGADGRHRALAAIQEGGENAKIHVRVIRHSFQGVN